MEIHDLKLRTGIYFFLSLLVSRSSFSAVTDGYVVKVDSATVYLDWGSATGVDAGDQFDVFRSGEELRHPVTKKVLGRSEQVIGQGVIEAVQPKFSTGKIIDSKGPLRSGDRTRLKSEPVATPAATVSAGASVSAIGAQAPVPQELWRSEPIKREATGVSAGDLDGDGKKELIVAYRNQIEVYGWNGKALASKAFLNSNSYRNLLTIDAADVEGAGRDKIFATAYLEGNKRARTYVFELADGKLKEVGRLDGFVRRAARGNGKGELLVQDLSMAREIRVRAPAAVIKKDSKYEAGEVVKFSHTLSSNQLFGYAWGDWDGEGSEDLAVLLAGERLRLFFKDSKWSSRETYGGSLADFGWEDDQLGNVYPRLVAWPGPAGKNQLLVPYNISSSPIRLARLKIYKQSEIINLLWNGLEMNQVWRLPITGAVADYALEDVSDRGAPQLWIAVVGAGDKTTLLSYQLP